MKYLSLSFLLIIFIYLVKSDTDAIPPGCFGTTGCWKHCEGVFGTCPSGFRQVIESDSKDVGNVCYCYRPYTKEELDKFNAGQCERYFNQCFSLSNASHSCIQALKLCDKEKQEKLCQIEYDSRPNKSTFSRVGYACILKKIKVNK